MKRLLIAIFVSITVIIFSGCTEKREVDFSKINSVCEMATLKCYYHNVAKEESNAKGMFKAFGVGYKKVWFEYSGIVELGINVNKVSVSEPNKNNVVKVVIPDAEILNADIDENSLTEPLTDEGVFTKVTKEEETNALASAQEKMKMDAENNTELLGQAKERAKKCIEGYIKNVGELTGYNYKIEWIAYKEK